ncbi:class I SAM-dependent methyltransferase [Oscillospiraceae bacterium MB08-C2-2]|nr:class I SAM-dependent methyltransferase [Oscillospiraceae bacterium MB08-C2-2]
MKLSVKLSGVQETMLIPMYARAVESQKENHNFYDQYAIEMTKKLDYDFSKFDKGKLSLWGCAARTIILDQEVNAFIKQHPNCTCINLGCGLDTRFHRVDNGSIRWYNVDFQSTADLRAQLLPTVERETMIACSALESDWVREIAKGGETLIIMEGLIMYFSEDEIKGLMGMIRDAFPGCTLLIELISAFSLKNQKKHDALKKTSAVFQWGVKEAEELVTLCPYTRLKNQWNYTPVMKRFSPLFITLISPMLANANNRIAKYEIPAAS